MTEASGPVSQQDPSLANRLTARIEKNLLVILGGIILGAFLAGIGVLVFIQKIVKSEIEDHWKGQLASLAKATVDEQIKQRFGKREPALAKHFRAGLNECARLNEVQYCWGRETKTPKWDAKAAVNTVDHSFEFAAPFESTPVVTVGIYPTGNQKMWGVYSSTRTPSAFKVRAKDISNSPQSEEHVLVSYLAIGTAAKD
jgi:hypothetical protein